MNAIEFNDVHKKFKTGERFNSLRDAIPGIFKKNGNDLRDFWALKGVTFQVKQGDVLGIIGPNGAGKSTILKLLSRIMLPTKGEVKIHGRVSALIEVTAGFHDELTGRENVYLNGTILGMARKEIDRKFDQIVDFSGLKQFIDTPVKRYSSGMYSRLGFSVAAHMDPDTLLVDEVLAVGDIAFRSKCAQKMRQLLSSGVTIVLVSHNIPLVQNLCKRVILLDKGTKLKEGSSEDIIPYYQDLVYRQSEAEVKQKSVVEDGYKVSLTREDPALINEVSFYDAGNNKKDVFGLQDEILVEIGYELKARVENPVFSLDIVRSDDVVCCSSNSKEADIKIVPGSSKGRISLNLGQLRLSPGVYIAKVSIWDPGMINTFAMRKKDVFRIKADSVLWAENAVYIPRVSWQLQTP